MPVTLTYKGEPDNLKDMLDFVSQVPAKFRPPAAQAPPSPSYAGLRAAALGMVGPSAPTPAAPSVAPARPISGAAVLGSVAPHSEGQSAGPQATSSQSHSVLGKIGRRLETAGEIAGTALAPFAMPFIPGTPQHQRLEDRREQAQAQIGEERALTSEHEAQAEEQRARALKDSQASQSPAPATAESGGMAYQFNPQTGSYDIPIGSPKAPATRFEPRSLAGQNGQPIEANFETSTGRYFDSEGKEIKNPQPYEKPPAVSEPSGFAEYQKEHPNATIEQFWQAQNALKPEFPRIQPVTDAQGNITGWATFTGTAGGVKPGYVPVGATGAPTNLGETPGVIPPKPTATVLTQSQRAEMIQPAINATVQDVDRISGQLGPLKGRWNDLMAGKVGVDNPAMAELQMRLKLFTTALMLAHGLRGEEYEKSLGDYLRASQSPDNLKARIRGANDFLMDYAGFTGHGPGQGKASGAASAAPKAKDPLGIF